MIDILPNSLTKTPRIDSNMPGWYFLYCANCGDEVGRVRQTELPQEYAFALCNDCVDRLGEPAGAAKAPVEIFMDKVTNAMLEDYGRVLGEREVLIELDNPSSVISKLEREGPRR